MTDRKWIRASLAAALLMLVPPVAGAAGGAGATPAGNEVLDAPAQWGRPQSSAYEQLVAAQGTRIDRAAFDALRRGLLAMSSGPAAATADPEFVFPSRAGDLDGDGKGDVLTFEFAGEDSILRARRGIDGSELWAVSGAHLAIPADLDGNGAAGVLTLATERSTLAEGVHELRQTVALRDGAGAPIWSYEAQGAFIRKADYEGGVASDVEFVVGVRTIPDATGDGLPDVWVGTQTFGYAHVEMIVEADLYTGRTIDGATGLEAGRVVAAGANGMPWVVPGGDVNGDGLADSFAMTGIAPDLGLLSAHSALGAPHWVRPVATNFAYPSVHEMTGDGIPDVMLQSFSGGAVSRDGFSGASGEPLWSRPDAGTIDAAGDIDGDGGTDMIQLETIDSSLVATGWSGATGQDVWGPATYAGPEGAWIVFCFCTDDLTGDGVWDPLTAEVQFTEPPQVTVRTLDGATGNALWVADVSASGSFPVPIGADVDGDGAGDLGVGSSTGSDVAVATHRGFDFAPIWTATAPMEGFPLGFYGDDLTGDGEPEIVLASIRFVEEWFRGSAHALSRTGMLWTVP